MVRHIAAHDGIFLPVDPLGAEIGGLIEAAAARHLHLLQLVEVFNAASGSNGSSKKVEYGEITRSSFSPLFRPSFCTPCALY